MIGHQGIPVGRLPGLGIMRPSMKAGSESKPAKSGLPCRTSHSINLVVEMLDQSTVRSTADSLIAAYGSFHVKRGSYRFDFCGAMLRISDAPRVAGNQIH